MKAEIYLVLFLVTVFQPPTLVTSTDAPVVKLKQGELQGVGSKTRNGADYYAYWGIPFAKPPKRFQPPEPPAIPSWKGVRNAAKAGPGCLTRGFDQKVTGSEDCLFVNVFTKTKNAKAKLSPVIVFIHPGGFRWSSGDTYGADYLLDEDVVFVTINYRLSSLGFLNVGHFGGSSKPGLAAGNMGLKDQTQALIWVRENIKAFGGDPERITIFGNSAGSASVVYHILSPLSKGLFHRAIATSGSPLCSWGFTPNPTFYAKELGRLLDCPVSESEKLIDCLLKKDGNEIVEKSDITLVPGWSLDPLIPFGPTIEVKTGNSDVFLSDLPETLFHDGKFQEVPLMIGLTKHEGYVLHAATILQSDGLMRELHSNWSKILPITFTFEGKISESKWKEATEEIRTFYFGSKDGQLNADGLEQMFTDGFFQHGIRATVLHVAKKAAVYPYNFDYWLPDSGFQQLYTNDLRYSGKIFHGDDLFYVVSGSIFGVSSNLNNPDFDEFSKKYVKLLMSFVNSGAPDASIFGSAQWPKTSQEEAKQKKPLKWYQFSKNPSHVDEYVTDRMKFWDQLFQKYSTPHDEL